MTAAMAHTLWSKIRTTCRNKSPKCNKSSQNIHPDILARNQNLQLLKHKIPLLQILRNSARTARASRLLSFPSLFIIINNKTGSRSSSYPGVKYVVCTTYPCLIWQTRNQNITPTQIGACANIRCKYSPPREINKTGKQDFEH